MSVKSSLMLYRLNSVSRHYYRVICDPTYGIEAVNVEIRMNGGEFIPNIRRSIEIMMVKVSKDLDELHSLIPSLTNSRRHELFSWEEWIGNKLDRFLMIFIPSRRFKKYGIDVDEWISRLNQAEVSVESLSKLLHNIVDLSIINGLQLSLAELQPEKDHLKEEIQSLIRSDFSTEGSHLIFPHHIDFWRNCLYERLEQTAEARLINVDTGYDLQSPGIDNPTVKMRILADLVTNFHEQVANLKILRANINKSIALFPAILQTERELNQMKYWFEYLASNDDHNQVDKTDLPLDLIKKFLDQIEQMLFAFNHPNGVIGPWTNGDSVIPVLNECVEYLDRYFTDFQRDINSSIYAKVNWDYVPGSNTSQPFLIPPQPEYEESDYLIDTETQSSSDQDKTPLKDKYRQYQTLKKHA